MNANMEFDDDEEEWVEPYDCTDLKNEPRPDSVVYQPLFAQLKEQCQEAANLLLKPLNDSEYHNAITRGLLKEVQTRTKTEGSEDSKFAVVGDMASGKSTLINSALGMGTIARKGDGGGSCTWVVQRFIKEFLDQSAPYSARVYFFSADKMREILKSLLVKYYNATGRGKDNMEDDGEKDDNVENFDDMRTVLDTFMPLFCEHDDFENEDCAKDFLKDGDDEDILETLVSYAEEVMSRHLEGQEFVSINASTAEELLFHLRPYAYTIKDEDGRGVSSPWPLVSVIDFGLDCPLLNEGIIFVDTPGLSDANSTRAENAKAHHRQCTHMIIVAEIGRAMDDKALRKNLADGYKARGSGNIILVLTHGDVMHKDTDVSGNGLEMKTEQMLRDELKVLQSDISKLRQRRQNKNISREDRLDLANEIRTLEIKKKKKERQWEALRIEIRNRSVIRAMQKIYKDLTHDLKPLSAFVIGNDDYNQHVAGYSADERPVLSVKQTGIPSLRQRILLLPSEGKLNEAVHLATTQLPSLINSVELFCSKTHMARSNEIRAIIEQPKEFVKAHAHLTMECLKTEVQNQILTPMKLEEGDWTRTARILCRRWNTGSLLMLRKYGFKKGRKKSEDDVSWNDQLTDIKKDAMEAYSINLQNAIIPQLDELRQKIYERFDGTKKMIRNDRQFNLMALNTFLQSFNLERPNIKRCIDAAARNLKKDIGNIQQDVLMYEGETFMFLAMERIYDDVGHIKGKGGPKKRMDAFEKRVTKPGGVWADIYDRIERAFEKLLEEALTKLGYELESIIDGILQKFNLLCNETVVRDEHEKAQEEGLRQELWKNLIMAREIVEGPVHQLAQDCKNYSKA